MAVQHLEKHAVVAMPDVKPLLLRLSRSSERADPLVFAGRDRAIEETIGRTEVLPPSGEWGNTVLIEGAPGAGKTALVREIARQLTAAGATAIVQPNVPQSEDVEAIYAELATALAGMSPDLTRTTASKSRNLSASATVIRGGGSSGTSVSPPKVMTPRAVEALRIGKPWLPDDKAVVFVDEVQNVEPNSAAAGLLSALHTQQGIPVLLVCAGLSNSRSALECAGLSRIGTANIIRLAPLSAVDAAHCVRGTFDIVRKEGLGGSDEVMEQWAQRVAQASDGWPKHLQNYLRACWLTLLEQDVPSLDTADLNATIRRGDSLRERYYSERVGLTNVPIEVIGAMHERLAAGETLDAFGAVSLIGEAIDGLADPRVRQSVRQAFPEDGDCFERLLRVGVVSMDERDCCVSPVPSFSQFVRSRCRSDSFPTAH